jgi:sugar lactone lactonase YvrE
LIRADHNIFAQLLVVALLLALPINLFAADARYETGLLIDLATVRGAKATASDNLRTDHPEPAFLLHRAEGEIRYDNHFGRCWWMMELPAAYNVSDLRLWFRDVITSIGFQIKVAEEPPQDWAKVPVIASFIGPVVGGPGGQRVAELHFNSIKAKLVRIEFTGHNGGENGSGTGHEDLVVSGAQVWGPNDPAVTPAISVAQSAWAGGSCTLHDCTTDDHAPDGKVIPHAPVDCAAAVNDNDPSAQPGGNPIVTFFARGSATTQIEQTDAPASFFVTLKNRIRVVAVGYAAATADRAQRPRDMKVYTSSLGSGDEWTLQKELTDIRGGAYVEITLDHPAPAQRVRFDVERVWNPNVDAQRKAAEGHISQLYVYGEGMTPDIEFSAGAACQASCRIFNNQGGVVRNLQFPQSVQPGAYGITWDGLDDAETKMPPGEYEARVTLNPTVYTNAGNIGNTALPPTIDQNPTQIDSVAADADGNIYTADVWDEAAQDFRKCDRDSGQHVFDAHGLIRNGDPNGLAYAIAVDDKYIYCATTSHTNHAQQHLRRFRLSDGQPAPFPTAPANGHILIHDRPEAEIPAGTSEAVAQLMKLPLRAMVVVGDKLFVTDALAGKVLSFDRETGAALGGFDVNLPHALAADSKEQLWVGHENNQITVFSQDGKQSRLAHSSLGFVRAMAFGPGDTLYVADSAAGKVLIFSADGKSRTFGQAAKPGDYAPDHFYQITGLAVDATGNLTVAQKLPVDGARVTRFATDGKVIWDQLGGEFCDSGNISAEHPDEILTQLLHRYIVNKQTGQWEFRGSVLDGDPRYFRWQHGAMRIQKLGGNEFIFQAYGDGLQVYRRVGDVYRLCSMFGCANPFPDGVYRDVMSVPADQRPPKRLWSWHDVNGNGKVDEDEIIWEESSGKSVEWDNFGVNVDRNGNALLCEFNNSITEVPMTGFDERGNPIYDLFKRRTIVPPDHSANPLLSDPIMAVRADDGSIYVHSRSKVFPAPSDNGGSWMTGWMLARYDRDGKRLWYTRLPEACPGMDYVPGGGVMLVAMKWGKQGSDIYHYTADGALIGVTHPSDKFRGIGGIPDNTGSLCISRDPRDGIMDMFVEDCVDNHFQWYRVDDRKKPTVLSIRLMLAEPGKPVRTLR